MAETLEQKADALIQLAEVPDKGRPIGRPKLIYNYIDISQISLMNHIPEGANAFLFSGQIKMAGYSIRAVQFYQIPEKR